MLRRPLAAVLLLCLLLALAGCASSSDSADDFSGEKEKVAQVFDDLTTFAKRTNGTRICEDVYSDELAKSVAAQDPKRSCGEAVKDGLEDIDSTDLDVKTIEIDGTKAIAVVESKSGDNKETTTFALVKGTDGWRLSNLGS